MSYEATSFQAGRIRELEEQLKAEKQRLDRLERLLMNGEVKLYRSHTQRVHIEYRDEGCHASEEHAGSLRDVLDAVQAEVKA